MKITFCAIPFIETAEPIMAPAVLKAVAERAGHEASTLDLNQHFIHKINRYEYRQDIIDFLIFEGKQLNSKHVSFFVDILNQFTKMIMDTNPDTIGLSLLTSNSQVFCRWLAIHLKSKYPNIPILIGGSGIKNFIANTNNTWVEELRQTGIIDHYIMGDGELSLVEFLKGNYNYSGINSNSWTQLTDLDSLPYPDYSDYDWALYQGKVIQVVDSRGCVRNCEFCDIIEHWTKYQYRKAENVFKEMLYQIYQHGITDFAMRNSLTNGNMREFEKLLDLIVNYNETHEKQITWYGYFIIRSEAQHPERIFSKLAKSNGRLYLGVESVIHHVRWSLGKKFTNEDIDYHLEMGRKYKVPMALLVISSYPTETLADLEFTKKWFQDRLHYAGNPVYQVSISYASILPGTQLEKKSDEYNIEKGRYPSVWFNTNLAVTAEIKVNHMRELLSICEPYQRPIEDISYIRNKDVMEATLNVAYEFSND